MPIIEYESLLHNYPLSEWQLVSIYDQKNNRILSESKQFPFIFAIKKQGKTPVNRFISDVKTRYGKNRFSVLNEHQTVLYFERVEDNQYYFRSDEPKQYIFDKKQVETFKVKQEINKHLVDKGNVSYQKISNKNARYKGNAIGNSQNLFIRNILSNLGEESFSTSDWQETLNYFNHCCAYCSKEKTLIMEHAIPINKSKLGEHKLGNLIPSCKECNNLKHNESYDIFLKNEPDKLRKIQKYMESKKHKPLATNPNFEAIQEILELAHGEVGVLADRYITILNKLNP